MRDDLATRATPDIRFSRLAQPGGSPTHERRVKMIAGMVDSSHRRLDAPSQAVLV
ncbi:MAG: hypothetical protein NVV74_18355 [Magnetospirillum sp.]|nr:hypothetical protein [Magnetospirillum sp.]